MGNTADQSTTDCLLEAQLDRLRLYLRQRLPREQDVQDLAQESSLKMLQAQRTCAQNPITPTTCSYTLQQGGGRAAGCIAYSVGGLRDTDADGPSAPKWL